MGTLEAKLREGSYEGREGATSAMEESGRSSGEKDLERRSLVLWNSGNLGGIREAA